MGFADELGRAISGFESTMQRLQTKEAFRRASREIEDINEAADLELINEKEQRQQQKLLANQLAQQLLATGAPATTIQQAAATFGPEPLPSLEQQFAQAVQEGDIEGEQRLRSKLLETSIPFQREAAERAFRREEAEKQREFQQKEITRREKEATRKLIQQRNKEQKKITRALDKETRARVNDRQKEFNRISQDSFKALDQATSAERALKARNPVADSAIKTMLAKASGEVGNLTEAEREMFAGSPALKARAGRLLRQSTIGTLPESDRRDLRELITIYQQNARGAIKRRAETIAGQLATTTGQSQEDALKQIVPNAEKIFGQQQQPAQAPAFQQPTAPQSRFRQFLRER